MYPEYTPKITVGCRISTELREQLESEARQQRQTLSAYIETLLMRRDNVHVDVNDLKMRLYQLEAENQALRSEKASNAAHSGDNAGLASGPEHTETVIRTLKLQKMELQTELRRLAAERDTIMRVQTDQRPGWLSASGYDKVLEHVSKIRERYPAVSPEQALLAALAVTWRNEHSLFFVLTLGDYWKRYPLTLINAEI
jgi:chromosome segregation ATPase